jgi:predicted ribosome quality control (RQC) complex YloA/Tae2 family protein
LHRNYFFWKNLAIEAHQELQRAVVSGVFTYQKNQLTLAFAELDRSLVLALDPRFPYLLVQKSSARPAQSLELFPDLVGQAISHIELVSGHRCARITFADRQLQLWFSPFGGQANIILRNGEMVQGFKRARLVEPWHLMPVDWLEQRKKVSQLLQSSRDAKSIRMAVPQFNQRYLELMLGRPELAIDDLFASLYPANEYRIYYDPSNYQHELLFGLGNSFPHGPYKEYASAQESLAAILFFFRKRQARMLEQSKLINKMETEIAALDRSLQENNRQGGYGERSALYRRYADTIMANLHAIRPHLAEVSLPDIFVNENTYLHIPLKKGLTPQKNAENYYRKANEVQHRSTLRVVRGKRLEQRIKEILEAKAALSLVASEREFRNWQKKYDKGSFVDKQRQPNQEGVNARRYSSEDGWTIYVGKDDRSNDRLTFRIAKNNDIWLHASGVPGSHVVIKRPPGHKDNVPKNILHLAASFAAYYSKNKNAGQVPVIYTEARFVSKRKGAAAGSVGVRREKTIFAKPQPVP